MTPAEISVRGSHSVRLYAERATIHATLFAEGPLPQPVFDRVAAALGEVAGNLQSRFHAKKGPVTKLVIDQVRRGSHRPYDRDGSPMPVVHTATVSISATFSAFDELSDWVEWSSGAAELGISHIDWSLKDSTRVRAERAARRKAIRDAARRAQDYADALALGPVTIRTISDPGLAGTGPRTMMMAKAMAAPPDGSPQISLQPDSVEIEAQVEATFLTGGQ